MSMSLATQGINK